VNQKEYNINYSWFTEKKKKNRQQVARLKNWNFLEKLLKIKWISWWTLISW
jgi:hypothetical protein